VVPRAKGRRSRAKPPPRPTVPDALRLTKKEVVRRELATAIRLYVTNGDPVAIHVLTSAAAEILNVVGKTRAVETWKVAFLDRIVDEHRGEVEAALREPYNFMKHASSDADAEFDGFNPAINGVLLFVCCRDYWLVYDDLSPEMKVFMVLQATLRPQYVMPSQQAAFTKLSGPVLALAETEVLDMAGAARAIAECDKAAAELARLGTSLESLGVVRGPSMPLPESGDPSGDVQ